MRSLGCMRQGICSGGISLSEGELMNNIEYHIQCFDRYSSKYENEYNAYIENCMKERGKYGVTTVYLPTEEIEMVDTLRQAIYSAVVLLDRVKITDRDMRKFVSGIRYINNLFKHSTEMFEVAQISWSGIQVTCKIEDVGGMKFTDVKSGPILLFGDLDQVSIDDKVDGKTRDVFRKQKENYVSEIKGKDCIRILRKLESIIKEYYN